jgi:hypothetical protein
MQHKHVDKKRQDAAKTIAFPLTHQNSLAIWQSQAQLPMEQSKRQTPWRKEYYGRLTEG